MMIVDLLLVWRTWFLKNTHSTIQARQNLALGNSAPHLSVWDASTFLALILPILAADSMTEQAVFWLLAITETYCSWGHCAILCPLGVKNKHLLC